MHITTENSRGVTILRLDGRLIGEEAAGDATHRAVLDAVEGGATSVLLDLSKVPFVNSTGLGILVANFVRLRRREGSLKILNPTGRVKALFESVPQLFEIFYDEAEAVRSFSG